MNQPTPDRDSPIERFLVVSRLFSQNCFILRRKGRTDCVVVDPGIDFEEILELIISKRLTPRAILCTHGHADHIAGNEPLKRAFPDCELVIGRGDAPKLLDPEANLSARFGFDFVSPPADRLVDEGETVSYAGLDFEVLETPGHSSGHVVYILREGAETIIVGGDVLFREGVGRTDFPDGSWPELVASIREKLFTQGDAAIVLTGHGPETTIGHERTSNPFLNGNALMKS